MGINANVKQMIQSLADNDFVKAKSYAKVVLAADKTASTTGWRRTMMSRLDNQQPTLLDVPSHIQHMLLVEDLSETFSADRYYISKRDVACIEHIEMMRNVCGQLAGMGIRYLNSTLLFGDPGVGKTQLARYIAHRLGLPLVTVNFAKLIDSLLGKTSQNLYSVFHFVKNYECVLLIDELDAVGLKRTSGVGGAEGELNRVTITLMNELDKLSNDIVIIAATNRFDMIDPALARRFSHHHEMRPLTRQMPDGSNQIIEFATQYLQSVQIPYDEDELDSWVANQYTEFACVPVAKLENILNEFIVRTLVEKKDRMVFS